MFRKDESFICIEITHSKPFQLFFSHSLNSGKSNISMLTPLAILGEREFHSKLSAKDDVHLTASPEMKRMSAL